MLNFFSFILTKNICILSVEGEDGYIFGKLDTRAKLTQDLEFADKFIFKQTSKKNTYSIFVNHPDVIPAIDIDNSLVYNFISESLKPEDDLNWFEVYKIPEVSRIYIIKNRMCLTYNKILNRFYNESCNMRNPLQRFIPKNYEDGKIKKSFPLIEPKELVLLFE